MLKGPEKSVMLVIAILDETLNYARASPVLDRKDTLPGAADIARRLKWTYKGVQYQYVTQHTSRNVPSLVAGPSLRRSRQLR
jgi:hypothetical protein